MTGYSFTLFLHSALRWGVLVAGVGALVVSGRGWARARPHTRADELVSRGFTGLLDTQFLLGLALMASAIAALARCVKAFQQP